MNRRTFLLSAAAITLAAFVIREWFVLTMAVPEPNQGDVGDYLRYAMHLALDGMFSQANGPAVPDAYRSPAYPALLALLFPGGWEDGSWYARIYHAQALLGAATVAGVIALARTWLSRPWALAAGVWMAVQAHHVAATGAILTEVLFGLLLIAGLLAAAYGRGLWAGVGMGAAYLTNPVAAFLPFLLKLPRRQWLAMAGVMLLCIGGWALRNASVGAEGARAGINFVQGSWQTYHKAARFPSFHVEMNRQINGEIALMQQDTLAGLGAIGERLARDPAGAVEWYAGKPYLLWEWDVRIGKGQHYTIDQRDTITHSGVGLVVSALQWTLNPLVFALAFCGIILALVRGGPERMVAITVVYVTAVHVVLQAEPRHAIPYRSLEILLAASAMAYLWRAPVSLLVGFQHTPVGVGKGRQEVNVFREDGRREVDAIRAVPSAAE